MFTIFFQILLFFIFQTDTNSLSSHQETTRKFAMLNKFTPLAYNVGKPWKKSALGLIKLQPFT